MGNKSSNQPPQDQDIRALVTQLHLANLDREYLKSRILSTLDGVDRRSKRFTKLNYFFKCVLYPSSVSLLLYVYQKWSSNDYVFWAGIVIQLLGLSASAIADTMQIPRKLPLIKKYKDDLEHEMWCYFSLISDYKDLNHQDAFKLVSERCEAIITRNERYLRQMMSQSRNASGSYRNTEGPVLAENDAFVRMETVHTETVPTVPPTPQRSRSPITIMDADRMPSGSLDVPEVVVKLDEIIRKPVARINTDGL